MNATKLLKNHLPKDTPGIACSYQELIEGGFYGFMDFYLSSSKNDEKMSTTADYDVTMKLAQIDQQRDNTKYFLSHCIISLLLLKITKQKF